MLSTNLLRLILNRFYEKKFGLTCWFPSRHYCKTRSQSPMASVKILIRAKNIVSVFLYELVTEQSTKTSASTVKTIRVNLNKFYYDYLSRIFKWNSEGRAGLARKQFSGCLLIFFNFFNLVLILSCPDSLPRHCRWPVKEALQSNTKSLLALSDFCTLPHLWEV